MIQGLIVKQVTLCTGDRVYHATCDNYPLVYGEGKTEQQAIDDLKKRITKAR